MNSIQQHAQSRSIRPTNTIDTASAPRALVPMDGPIERTNKPQTIDAVRRVLSEFDAELRRDCFPGHEVRVEKDRIIAGEREYLLTGDAFRRVCKRFKAPADYLSRLSPDLCARIFQEHLAGEPFSTGRHTRATTCIVSRNGAFVDWDRADLFALESAAVVQAVTEGVGNGSSELEVANLDIGGDGFILDVVCPRLAEEVRPGDVIRGGIHVVHSQLDGEATRIMAFIHRLVCSNGLVQRECLGAGVRSTPRTRRQPARHADAREVQMEQIRKIAAKTWSGLQQKLDAIRHLHDKRVEIRVTLERFLRQAHLFSHGLLETLLQAWQAEGSEPSAFGALNALTRVATHSRELPSWKRQRLARLAGIYANQDVHLCPHCFSVLAA